MSFLSKSVAAESYVLELVKGMEDGQPFYAYTLIYGNKHDDYKQAVDDGLPIELKQYGIVLLKGYGHEIRPEDQDWVEDVLNMKLDGQPVNVEEALEAYAHRKHTDA